MVTTERPTVVIDVAARWAVDAVLFLAMSVGFMAWGVIARSSAANILTFAVMATVAMLLDRMSPLLPDAAALAQAHERPPDDAVRRTWRRYAVGAAAAMAALFAFLAVFAVIRVEPGFFAGWMAAFFVSRLRGLVAAREVERASGVRLSVAVRRSVWRRRTQEFYATPRTA
jgi:hypothetical protein